MFCSKGFTLVELVISLLIIGLLSSISISSYSTIQKRAKERTLISLVYNFQLALESYYLALSRYPDGNNVSIGDIEALLLENGDLTTVHTNPFTGAIFSLNDSSGLALYSYDVDTDRYSIEVYGYLNEEIILILE